MLHLCERPHRGGTVLILSLAILFFSNPAAEGEDPPGGIRGTVRDRAGSPIAGSTIAVTHVEEQTRHQARADADGQFEIQGLVPGTYDVEASGEGFASLAEPGVRLEAGELRTLALLLEPAAPGQSASGQAETQGASRTASANVGTEISEAQLVGLPLNGRSYSQLATLQSSVNDPLGGGGARGGGGSGSLTVSGGRSSSNTFLMDGTNIMDSNNQVPRSAAGVQLGSDAVLQVQVYGLQYSAEYGRGSGGVLNSISRSGADQFHGTAFEYFRNSKLDARWFFDRPTKPPFKRNQFGSMISGPIVRGRTYFMGSWEAMRDRLTSNVRDNVPDGLARQGIITNEKGELPLDSAGNVIRLDVHPRVKPYLELYSPVNDGILGGGYGRNTTPTFLPTNENFFTVRVDHRIADKDSVFVRYTFDDASSYSSSSLSARTLNNSRQQYLTVTESHIFSPRLLSAFRAAYTRPVAVQEAVMSKEIPSDLFFVPGAPQFGQLSLPGAGFGPGGALPQGDIMNSFQFAADVLAQRGTHGLKFGGEVHRYRWDTFTSANKSGSWSFNSLESFLELRPEPTTAISVALPGADAARAYRQSLVGVYLQDEYRPALRLQLSLGLRYEFATLIQDRQNRTGALPDPVRDTAVQVGPLLGRNPSLRNFSPRFGATWAPTGTSDLVVSAGFGIYYDQLLEHVVDSLKTSVPFYQVVSLPNIDASQSFPNASLAATRALAAGGSSPLQAKTLDYRNMKSPTLLRYNLSLRGALGEGWRYQASYVGTRGNHLYRNYEINQFPVPVEQPDGSLFFPPGTVGVNPAFGSVNLTSSDAQSFYNSLQLSANRSLGQGASVQVSYTFAKSIDDTTSSGNSIQFGPARKADRALSDFDLRHRLVMSYFYTSPFGERGRWLRESFLGRILGGWRLGGIVSTRNGTPINMRISVRNPGYLFAPNRPDLVPGRNGNPIQGETTGCPGVAAGRKVGTADYYVDPCAFSVPKPGTLGNNGRNTVTGPRVFSTDLSLQREFLVYGKSRLQFRAEVFNLTNRTNLRPFAANAAVAYSGSHPGRVNGAVGNFTNSVTTSRQMQFALRLSF